MYVYNITPDQHLLLKAAVFPYDEALEYWKKWKTYHNVNDSILFTEENALTKVLDSIDRGSHRLLPLVYRNLEASSDVFIQRLRGLYRHSWMRNQQLLHRTREIATILNDAGIDTLLLKGMAMSLIHYGDMGARYMNDLDLLVPYEMRDKALLVLKASNLRFYINTFDYQMRNYNHALHIYSYEGHNLDLHHHLLFSWRSKKDDLLFWQKSEPLPSDSGLPCKVLSPTHQFFHSLVHGNFPNIEPDIRWVADCYEIYKANEIDWCEIFTLANRLRLNWPVKQGMRTLIEGYGLTLPAFFQRDLETLVVDSVEEEYRKFLYDTWHIEKDLRKFYNLARYKYTLYYKDYSQQSFARWFSELVLTRAIAGAYSSISLKINS